jgi:mRNA interferase MazF
MPKASRGEVSLVDLGMAAKTRPCVVLSVAPGDSDRALVSLVAHTTSPRGTAFEVGVATRFLRRGAFDAQNLVTVPFPKLIRKLGTLPTAEFNEVESAVRR